VAILDRNDDLGQELVDTLGQHRARFFQTDVTSSSSIAQAMEGVVEWTRHSGKDLGGVVAAAGILSQGKVCHIRAHARMNARLAGLVAMLKNRQPYFPALPGNPPPPSLLQPSPASVHASFFRASMVP
jgi:NADP-dependent 3-hydroxy acid dehydrogenase YdfG